MVGCTEENAQPREEDRVWVCSNASVPLFPSLPVNGRSSAIVVLLDHLNESLGDRDLQPYICKNCHLVWNLVDHESTWTEQCVLCYGMHSWGHSETLGYFICRGRGHQEMLAKSLFGLHHSPAETPLKKQPGNSGARFSQAGMAVERWLWHH